MICRGAGVHRHHRRAGNLRKAGLFCCPPSLPVLAALLVAAMFGSVRCLSVEVPGCRRNAHSALAVHLLQWILRKTPEDLLKLRKADMLTILYATICAAIAMRMPPSTATGATIVPSCRAGLAAHLSPLVPCPCVLIGALPALTPPPLLAWRTLPPWIGSRGSVMRMRLLPMAAPATDYRQPPEREVSNHEPKRGYRRRRRPAARRLTKAGYPPDPDGWFGDATEAPCSPFSGTT